MNVPPSASTSLRTCAVQPSARSKPIATGTKATFLPAKILAYSAGAGSSRPSARAAEPHNRAPAIRANDDFEIRMVSSEVDVVEMLTRLDVALLGGLLVPWIEDAVDHDGDQ